MNKLLALASRLTLTKIVKEGIIRGLKRGMPDFTENEMNELANHIMDELGKDSENVMEVVREFFVKG